MTAYREGRSPDRLLSATPLVRVGHFRARVEDPWFRDSGPIQRPVFVFPRTSLVIHHEGKRPFTTDTCTVTYYNRGQRYTRRPIDPRGDICDWFSVREDALRDVLASHDRAAVDRAQPFRATHGPSDAWSYTLQRQLVRHLETAEDGEEVGLEEAVLGLLDRVIGLLHASPWGGTTAEAASLDAGDEIVERVRRILIAQFASSMTLDDIAAASEVSVFHMCREFKRRTGTTIHRYRNQLRLRRSLELVADPAADLTRVALDVGYSSHSHFTQVFRRAFSVTPSQFRKTATARRVRELTARLRSAAG